MWQWLLILLLISAQSSIAASPQTQLEASSRGPVSDEEARLLWKEGKEALGALKFQDAANSLQRLIHRYPGYEGYRPAHFLLAQALMELGRAKEAIAPLKSFIESTPAILSEDFTPEGHLDRFEGIQARIALGWSYLKVDLPNEARLLAIEIEALSKTAKFPNDLTTEMLLLKSQALLALHRHAEAQSVSDSAITSLTCDKNAPLRAKVYENQLQLKTLSCALLGAPESWTSVLKKSRRAAYDAQIRDQIKRRGTCLEEALLTYRKILEVESSLITQKADQTLKQAYAQYRRATLFEKFHVELRDLLYKEYKSSTAQAVDLLTSWKPSLSPKMVTSVENLSQDLQKTSKGNR